MGLIEASEALIAENARLEERLAAAERELAEARRVADNWHAACNTSELALDEARSECEKLATQFREKDEFADALAADLDEARAEAQRLRGA